MPEIQAFRGLRYNLGHVGSLGDVVAPPYDVIGPEQQTALYKRHPANVIRLILNRSEPGDDEQQNRYSRAARLLKNWRGEGVLQEEPDPAIYVYHQCFEHGGTSFTRRGFMCRVRLQRFGEGTIYPHEETHSAAKADRLKLITACRANLSQIFGLYPDPDNEGQAVLEQAVQGTAPLEATDDLGVVHRLWPVTDVKRIAELAAIVNPKPMFVADGHHRYETACNYRDQLAESEDLPPDHPANFVLTMCVGMNDPGMIVLPTHRLFRGMPPLRSETIVAALGNHFQTRVAGSGPEHAPAIWSGIEEKQEQGTIGLYSALDRTWVVASITDAGRARLAELEPDRSPSWRNLGVSILHRLLVQDLLDSGQLPKPKYVHLVQEVVEGLSDGDKETGEPFPLAALVMPATLDDVREISEFGERMPAKSTYFYPKLLSGLVINPVQ